MNEVTTPALVPSATAGNLTNLIAERAWFEPERITMSRPLGDGWQSVTAREVDEEVRATAKGLIAAGIQIGDRVAIMARTRYEWTILDFAIWYAGAVVVPIYDTSSAEQIDWILNDSSTVGIIVETPALRELVQTVIPSHTKHVWVMTEDVLTVLRNAGAHVSDDEIERRRAALGPDTLATLIYTSGTTGKPKGVSLTHGNFLAECGNVVQGASDLFLKPGGSTLLFLPVAHVFGRMVQIGAINSGLHLAHCSDPLGRLPIDLASFKPTFVLAVPRIFEKIYNGAEARAEAAGKGKIFRKAADVAIAYSEALDKKRISPILKLKHGLFDKLVYSKIRAGMGGRVEAAISGGAPLGVRLGHFYRGAGVTILEGYGLTETTAGATLNLTGAHRVGSVGRPIPGTSIKIAEDGEVLIRGAIVMRGYWQNDAANAEVFDSEGWFKSGDLGKLDDEGFLYIVGRKKELIVTAGGKNVAPAVLEDRLRAHPLVSQCLVVGDNQPFIAALITIDQDALKGWVANHKKEGASMADLANDPDLIAVIQTAVDDANKAVSKAESIRKFTILTTDFTIAGGHLTQKLSIKRHVVAKEFAKEIDQLFTK
ncbi:MAG: long-chain fatty acid--CoA ligase [Actinobacteria bacterium]|jgi:long-chain acyl-CoA synthetase|nr:long-chain fatty acid--CoA ligase [Actinomycetota bacterium]NCV82429.1 long-chain fatty acid--CoA ligase [Actinomycetota bacterium]NCW42815.1 long-chain fatty acid--CoA ligase [Actinomycetota bacterium]NCW71705.1 long-chain fatty acid--CoA ligase [Actinomycetota bacterium]NCW92686.1 long-chain fatty acid--CoA ligase [Actinomycetota bacterium]